MHNQPMILPLDIEGKIYSILDEKGNTIGTGSREVCEILMYMITRGNSNLANKSMSKVPHRPNVRAAIGI